MKKYKNNRCLVQTAYLMVLAGVMWAGNLSAQNTLPYDTSYTFDHYKVRRAFHESLPKIKNEIVFLGNSITERAPWSELFKHKDIINRGIGGDVCFGVLNRLDEIVLSSPKCIFLMIGINDIGRSVPVDTIAGKIQEILWRIREKSPHTKIYLQSILPINEEIFPYDYMKGKSDQIVRLNDMLRVVAEEEKIRFIDLYSRFADEKGQLIPAYTADGIHLSVAGYLLWRDVFKEKGIRF